MQTSSQLFLKPIVFINFKKLQARRSRPCILFFDEIDAVSTNREAGQEENSLYSRLLSTLLNVMDGISGRNLQNLRIFKNFWQKKHFSDVTAWLCVSVCVYKCVCVCMCVLISVCLKRGTPIFKRIPSNYNRLMLARGSSAYYRSDVPALHFFCSICLWYFPLFGKFAT